MDPETGNIRMRRSHLMINNYNEYIISACRSNMDIKFIWTGSDAKALVYYITDYVTKSSLPFHDTFSLIQKNVASFEDISNQVDNTDNVIERSRKFVLRCYNTLASQQELSGAQVASYLMNWDDHYTTHKFQGLYLIQNERYLQTELNGLRVKRNLETDSYDAMDEDDERNDNVPNDENDNEENFQIQSVENENGKSFVLVNARIDYQCRSHTLDNVCLYDFVSALYKKKINAADLKYLSDSSITEKEQGNRRGRPPNQRFPFQKHHPQVTTYLMMKHTEYRVPILYGPQIPRRDREDTQERYCRAILTFFVPWRTVSDLCDVNQKWEDALSSRQHHISGHSQNIIDNIQLLHECKKDRDEHLVKVITEAQIENDTIEPELFSKNQSSYDEYDDTSDSEDLFELLGNLNDSITVAMNSMKKSTENVSDLVRLNTKWQEQLKAERERVRRNLITGKHYKAGDESNIDDMEDTVVTLISSTSSNMNMSDNYISILPVASVIRDNNVQLIMCIPGCGGTGKSQLIRAVTEYFVIINRIQRTRKLAPTGIAAAEIDGMTIHSFLGEQRNSGKPPTIKSGDLKLEKNGHLWNIR
ncbi:unnamed protein product [Adineta ricciae]|uniref:DNA helicase n=2 Tax=Adineta ricciae TaxID=249248 RepID=A0A813YE03_ADIRI|nr:unnamed protein product [Adineta ricciae]